jgi:hypothetical protein
MALLLRGGQGGDIPKKSDTFQIHFSMKVKLTQS